MATAKSLVRKWGKKIPTPAQWHEDYWNDEDELEAGQMVIFAIQWDQVYSVKDMIDVDRFPDAQFYSMDYEHAVEYLKLYY